MPKRGEFPTRDNCDPNNPEEAFLWCFAALPYVTGGPLLMPTDFWRVVSKHLWELGVRPAAEPLKQWVPPTSSEPNMWTSPGRWVPAGQAPKADDAAARKAVERMSLPQRTELREALAGGWPFPDTVAGRFAASLPPDTRAATLQLLDEGVR